MQTDKVRKTFEDAAFSYDEFIPKIIPYYHEQNGIMLELIPFETTLRFQALDLGCGTGILSYFILKSFPHAKVMAFDLTENMLTACQKNLSKYTDRLNVRQGDFSKDNIASGYELIVSGLAIHHLDERGKKELFHKLFRALKPGGLLLIRDIVLGATPWLTEHYENLWREFIKSNGEDDEHWFSKYLDEDIPSTVENQLQWLAEAGFEDVGCHWRYLNYAIFGGRKPSAAKK